MASLSGKVAIVTGASNGIGRLDILVNNVGRFMPKTSRRRPRLTSIRSSP